VGDGRDGVFGLIASMCPVRDLLNNSSIDTNMDNYAEMILKHTRQTRRSRSRKPTPRGNSQENRGRTEEGRCARQYGDLII